MRTVILVGEVAERTDRLEQACRKCDRRGVLSVARLSQDHGATSAAEHRRVLAGRCERLKAGKLHDPAVATFRRCRRCSG